MKLCFILVLTLVFNLTAFADLPDCSFANNKWELKEGAKISNDVLVFEGNPDKFMQATCLIPAQELAKQKYFFLQLKIRLNNIKPGPLMYMRPKVRLHYGKGSKPIVKYNLPCFDLDQWTTVTLPCKGNKIGKAQKLRIEVGLQNCTGLMEVKDVVFTTSPERDNIFPYTMPESNSAVLNINSREQIKPVSDDLLGVNSHFVWVSSGYHDPQVKEILQALNIPHLRFPAGTVANFCDWRTDQPDFPEGVKGRKPFWINSKLKHGWKYGYEDYSRLCRELKMSSELTFNVMWGAPADSAERLKHRMKTLDRIAWVELGNENYFPGQNCGYAADVEGYIKHTKEMVKEMKKVDPQVKCAVNLEPEFDDHSDYGPWGKALANEDYYDGLVIHPYINSNSYIEDAISQKSFLRGYLHVRDVIKHCQENIKKPLVFSEWGIWGRTVDSCNSFDGLMGQTGGFFAILEGFVRGEVDQASYHILVGGSKKHQSSLFTYDKKHGGMKKTHRGLVHEMLIKAFKDSVLIKNDLQSPELEAGLPAIQAVAALKDDEVVIFVVNRLPKKSELTVVNNNSEFNGKYEVQSLTADIAAKKQFAINEFPLEKVIGTGKIELPAYSINLVKILK